MEHLEIFERLHVFFPTLWAMLGSFCVLRVSGDIGFEQILSTFFKSELVFKATWTGFGLQLVNSTISAFLCLFFRLRRIWDWEEHFFVSITAANSSLLQSDELSLCLCPITLPCSAVSHLPDFSFNVIYCLESKGLSSSALPPSFTFSSCSVPWSTLLKWTSRFAFTALCSGCLVAFSFQCSLRCCSPSCCQNYHVRLLTHLELCNFLTYFPCLLQYCNFICS